MNTASEEIILQPVGSAKKDDFLMSSLLKYFREDLVRCVWIVTTANFSGHGVVSPNMPCHAEPRKNFLSYVFSPPSNFAAALTEKM
jgi:hypothetical protein